MGISVVLPACNEALNLDKLLPLIIEHVEKLNEEYEVIVIDGLCTEDSSVEVCSKYNVKYINQEEPHFGGAYRTGIKYAKFDKYLVLDCDGSHSPAKIPELYKVFVEENCDLVIGSRYVKGGITYDPLPLLIMSKLLNNTYRFLLGIKVTDLSAGFRIYRTELLKNIELEGKNFDLMQEIIVKMRILKPDLKIREIPITFKEREHGRSKRNLPIFIFSFISTLLKLLIINFLSQKRMIKKARFES